MPTVRATPQALLLTISAIVLGVAVLTIGAAPWASRPDAPAAHHRVAQLRFADRPDGGIDVIDARQGRAVAAIEPGRDAFVRGALRALVRERRSRGLGAELPFELSVDAEAGLLLSDPATGRRIPLQAFGPTNSGAFARLLPQENAR